jgi:hypothetical protein
LLYGHYRIAYLVKDDGNIDVLGVVHGALDITRSWPRPRARYASGLMANKRECLQGRFRIV